MSNYRNKRRDVWCYLEKDTGRKQHYIVKSINPSGKDTIHEVIYDIMNDSCHCDCEYFAIHGERKQEWLDCSHVNAVKEKLSKGKDK